MLVMMWETWHPGNSNVFNSCSMDFILSFFGFLITQSHVCLWYRLYIILKIKHRFRSRKVVDTFEQLLGGEELYHYHSKLMMKEVMNSIWSLLKMNCSKIVNYMKLTNSKRMINMITPGRDGRAACVASRLWILVSATLLLFSCVVCGSKYHFIIRPV